MRIIACPVSRDGDRAHESGPHHARRALFAVIVALVAMALNVIPASATSRSGRIAFVCGPYFGATSANEICVANPDGSHRHAITHNDVFDSVPAWSPDGRRIAFTSDRAEGPGGPTHIWVMRRSGRAATQVSSTPGFAPAWSPDGQAIVFVTDSNPPRLRIVDAAGEREITGGTLWAQSPSWSIEGTIAFAGFDTSAPSLVADIFTMPANGGQPRNLTSAFPLLNLSPDWSPDGLLLAFDSDRASPFEQDIFSMAADGSSPMRLTNSPGLDVDPAWSPDGERLVFTSYRDNETPGVGSELYVINADGSKPRRITFQGGWNGGADWGSRRPPRHPHR
jgi:Tol biopolymer transport system component